LNEIRARAKEQLPSVLLTLMSIIQALALEFLWEVVRVTPRVFTWDAVLEWLQITATMFGILQLWMFYTSAAMRFRWTPTTQDLLFPFLIGILEFALIDLTGTHLALWFWMLAVLSLSVLAGFAVTRVGSGRAPWVLAVVASAASPGRTAARPQSRTAAGRQRRGLRNRIVIVVPVRTVRASPARGHFRHR